MNDTTATENSTATTDTGGANDTPSTPALDAGGEVVQTDDATVLGSATADAGTGTADGKDSTAAPTPNPVPDDDGVPEAYNLKLTTTAEDGTETAIEMDPALLEAATPVFKDIGLTNEQANKLLPLVPQMQERVIAQMNDEFAATRAQWAKDAKADPEIGGKNWTETQQLAAKALDHFTGPAENNGFRKLLNDSGLGNHPDMIRAFRKIGEALSEDQTLVRNTTTSEAPKSRSERLYPEDSPKAA